MMDEYELACVIALYDEAIRNLNRKINVQSSINSELREEIAELKSRVDELEKDHV